MTRRPAVVHAAIVAALLALVARPVGAASYPPELCFRSLVGPRVTVHFHQGREASARQALGLAEEILAAHSARYGVRVRRVHVVLADLGDSPNGYATPLPYPLVQVRAASPTGADEFGNHEGWLRLVLTHELAHVVHLERARALPGLGRHLLGRAPFLFPNTLTPSWMIEGLATLEETRGTAFGRGRDPDSRMVLRQAALEGRFPGEDLPAGGLDAWPGGNAPYLFGEAFLAHLEERHGPEVVAELSRVHAGRVVPFLDDLTARKVTGGGFHRRWREFSSETRDEFRREGARIEARGLTPTRALTRSGVLQAGPRFSPDGRWVAYTSRVLTRDRAIRLLRADGTGDRRLVTRNGGSSLSWTPDGRQLVYEEPEVHRTFSVFDDLRAVDVETGRVRRLTRGLRAREPDVSPDGRTVAFVRQQGTGAELALLALAGGEPRTLTRSEPETQWSSPRWSPDGSRLAASRWSPGGFLDVVLVDPASGEVVDELTHDRAKDVEPTWTPDGGHVVFRSDRDGVSNLHAFRLADRALLRLTNVLGGAFSPSVGPDGRTVALSLYGAGGYDVVLAELDLARAEPAPPFADPHPPSRPLPEPFGGGSRPYRPLPAALPRFWTPYAAAVSGEIRVGALTAGADPLLRHVWGLDLHRGLDTDRFGAQALYQYDRFRPTFLAFVQDTTSPADVRLDSGEVAAVRDREREAQVRATLPLHRRLRSAQSLTLAYRRSQETLRGEGVDEAEDLGGLEVAWVLDTRREHPFSISPVDGGRLRLSVLKEAPGLGSDVSLAKATADGRLFLRLSGGGQVLALRAAGGTTWGSPSFRRSFAVGGFADSGWFDVARSNAAVLRGYPEDAFTGRRFAAAGAEYRLPLGHPQRGWRLLPVFVRHLHAQVFADAAHTWSGRARLRDAKTGVGAGLGADVVVGHGLPLTGVVSLARGLADGGETRVDFRLGLAF